MYSSIGALKQIIQKEKEMKIVIEVLFYVKCIAWKFRKYI